MKRILAVVAVSTLMLGGCGSDPGTAPGGSEPTASVAEVGKDIRAGVYTSKDELCVGFTATSRDFSLGDEDPSGEMIEGAVQVRDQHRIVLRDGDFFHAVNCSSNAWKREEGGSPKSVDPSTVEGACGLLIEDGLLEDALEYPKTKESEQDELRRGEIQERLMSVVWAGIDKDTPLASAAGQIVDFLDDPKEYVEDGKLTPDVVDAVATINKTCD